MERNAIEEAKVANTIFGFRLILGVSDSIWVYGEDGLVLRQAGRVVNFADPLLSPALPQVQSGGGGVRDDVASDRLLGVGGEHGATVDLSHYLKLCKCDRYRVTHLANLGCVDFDFGCSTLSLALPGLMGNWQNWLSNWARWWTIPNQSQPNRGSPGDPSPCRSVARVFCFDFLCMAKERMATIIAIQSIT